MTSLLTFNFYTFSSSIISYPLNVSIFKRFYPGGKDIFLSTGTCQRLLRVLNKDNIYTNKFASNYIEGLASNLYKIHDGNRPGFFKSIRKVVIDNKITVPVTCVAHPLFHETIKNLAIMTYELNKPNIYADLSAQQSNKNKGFSEPLRDLSLEEKKGFFKKNHDTIIKKIKIIQEKYKEDKTIDWAIIAEWGQYLLNRGSVEPNYTLEEKNANMFLTTIFNENAQSRETILSGLEDKLMQLKMQSDSLDKNLFDKLQTECFLEQDYVDKIKALKEALTLLQTDTLNDNALILLAIGSQALLLDEESNPKLQRQVYTEANKSPNRFGIKYVFEKPDAQEIMEALENKKYFIKESSKVIPEGHLVSTAPLLHRAIIIPTKKGLYYGSILTSTKFNTDALSLHQEINSDPETQNKEQRHLVFPNFILCRDANITIDLLALGYSYAMNLEDEDVHEKIINSYKKKLSEWENNFIQEIMAVTPEVLKNIAFFFYQEALESIESSYKQLLLYLESLTEQEKKEFVLEILTQKEKKIEEQKEQRYFSKLPVNFQKLLTSLNIFEKESQRQQEICAKQKEKMNMKIKTDERELRIKQEKEERQRTGQLTLKEKREALQKKHRDKIEDKTGNDPENDIKNKPLLLENNTENAVEKKRLLVEDKK